MYFINLGSKKTNQRCRFDTLIKATLQRYNAKILQQAQYKIARVTGLLHEDHTDLNHTILNDRHIYDVGV
jgi:hypothetical protein